MNVYNFRDLEAFASRFYQNHPLEITPYAYSMTFSNLTAGATALQTLNFQANADFILTHIQAQGVNHASSTNITHATQILPLVRMLLTDSGSSQPLTNTPIDLSAYVEIGNFEKGLPYPRFLSGRSSLQVQLTSYDTALAYDIDVSFHGVNVRAVTG
jgi:hypothetical protein